MRVLFALAVVLVSTTAIGAEFRTLNFGAKCEGIAEREKALGSTIERSSQAKQQRQSIVIRAMHFEREALINYLCNSDNDLTAGLYEYPFDAYAPAVEYFHMIKPLLIADLGPPSIDSTSPEFATELRLLGPKAEELSRYSLLWGFARYSVSVAVITSNSNSSRAVVVIKYDFKKE